MHQNPDPDGPVAGPNPDDDYETLFRTDYPLLVRFVHYLGAGWSDAEDIATDAYVKLMRYFTTVEAPKPWLRTVARNDYRRRQLLQRSELAMTAIIEKPFLQPEYELSITDEVLKCIRDLPPRQREVMALTIDGFAPREIAEVLGLSSEAVRGSLRKARATVRMSMADEELDGGD
jgi:RNA polymerase sigma-70 factor (ECF subfamily)